MITDERNPLQAGIRPLDKELVRRIIEEQNRLMGFELDPDVTAEEAQALALAEGIRPEDNLLSRGITAARDE